MKKALQLWGVRNEMTQDPADTLRQIKQMGYDGVELIGGFFGHTLEETEKILNELDLTAISVHASPQEIRNDELMKSYVRMGLKYLGVQGFGFKVENGHVFDTAKTLNELGEITKKYGIGLLYHNHDYEMVKTPDGKIPLEVMYENTNPELLKCELDLAWVMVGGEDPCEMLLRYKGRCPLVHFKDHIGTKEQDDLHFTHLGSGKLPLEKVIDTCEKIGTEWIVVEQDSPTPGKTALESSALSLKALNNILQKKEGSF